MKAAYYTNYGAAHDVPKIGELPDPMPIPCRSHAGPVPGRGEVRVAVRYCGIDPCHDAGRHAPGLLYRHLRLARGCNCCCSASVRRGGRVR
jgi:hypothetical protein